MASSLRHVLGDAVLTRGQAGHVEGAGILLGQLDHCIAPNGVEAGLGDRERAPSLVQATAGDSRRRPGAVYERSLLEAQHMTAQHTSRSTPKLIVPLLIDGAVHARRYLFGRTTNLCRPW